MKLTAVFFIAGLLQVSAKGLSQNVTLSLEKVSLEKVFEQAEQQSGYYFLYKIEDLKMIKPISVSVKDMPIGEFVKLILTNQPLKFAIQGNNVVISKATFFPPSLHDNRFALIDISGRVSNKEGEPIAGATVQVKGSQQATSTDAEGAFQLKQVSTQATLVITGVSILTVEKPVNGQVVINVEVQGKTGKLDEVQFIAYGTTSQRYNTGSVSFVKADEIAKQPVNNPLLALQGRVPGVVISQQTGVPGGAIKIQLRGQNSINKGNEPLYIIDGLPISSTVERLFFANVVNSSAENPSAFSYLNPNNIESINILKDADATAIYGSRGANGVILITTKKGKSGRSTIDATVQYGIGQVPRKLELLNTKEWLELRREAFSNDGATPNVFSAPDLTIWDSTRYNDWQKKLIGGSASYLDAQVSFSGGTQQTQFMVSGTYHKESTVFPHDFTDQKVSSHLSLTTNSLNQKLQVNLSVSYMNDINKLPTVDLTNHIFLPPNAPNPTTADGSLNWGEPRFPGGPGSWPASNPFGELENKFDSRINNFIASGGLSYKIFKGLEARATFGYNYLIGKSLSTNPLSGTDPANWSFATRFATFGNTSNTSFIAEPQLGYKNEIGKLLLDAVAGASTQNLKTEFQSIQGYGFISDAAMKNIGAATTYLHYASSSDYRYNSVFARANLRYDNKYILNLNARRDGSSRFSPVNQFSNFQSIGAAWIFSNESFIKNKLKFIDFGKLRFSYGKTGNDQIGEYGYLDRYIYSTLTYQSSRGITSLGLFDPYFSWEKTNKLEGGIEIGLLKERIVFNVSYYQNRSSNQLITMQQPSYVGPGSIIINSDATVQNAGLEFLINGTLAKTKDVLWTSSFNISLNKNKIISYPSDPINPGSVLQRLGNPLGVSPKLHVVGVDENTGTFLFRTKDGNTTSSPSLVDDRNTFLTSTFPKYFGGFTNAITYKKWTFDLLIMFVKQFGFDYMFHGIPGNIYSGNQPRNLLQRWQKPGDIAQFQKVSQSQSSQEIFDNVLRESDYLYRDISYLKLKNVSLSYTVFQNDMKKSVLNKIRVFANGQNLFTITKYKGLDPESLSSQILPPLRVITFGIQLSLE